jgi:hypothetical protein
MKQKKGRPWSAFLLFSNAYFTLRPNIVDILRYLNPYDSTTKKEPHKTVYDAP